VKTIGISIWQNMTGLDMTGPQQVLGDPDTAPPELVAGVRAQFEAMSSGTGGVPRVQDPRGPGGVI
jgi:hypothetical protein